MQLLQEEEGSPNPDAELIADLRQALEETTQERRDADHIGAYLTTLRDQGAERIKSSSETGQREAKLRQALAEILPTNSDRYRTLERLETAAPRIQIAAEALCGVAPSATEILKYCREAIAEDLNRAEVRARV